MIQLYSIIFTQYILIHDRKLIIGYKAELWAIIRYKRYMIQLPMTNIINGHATIIKMSNTLLNTF